MGDEAEREITRLTSIPMGYTLQTSDLLGRMITEGRGKEMAVRRPAARSTRSGTRKPAAKAATPARRVAAPASKQRDVTVYADKAATEYHKAFARWIVSVVGFDPDSVSSKRAAFLKGVSIATAARPAFAESDYLEEWREKSGETKRGPKPKEEAEEAPKARRTSRKPAPVVEEDDEEFDDEEDEEFDDEDDSDSGDEFDDEEDSDEDDEEFDDEEDEPAPPAKTRTRATRSPSGTAKARKTAAPAKTRGTRAAKPAADEDDDFLF